MILKFEHCSFIFQFLDNQMNTYNHYQRMFNDWTREID